MPRPRRLQFCITSLGAGGAEKCLTNLITRLPRDRFSCQLDVLQSRPTEEQSLHVETLAAADVPVRFHDARRIWDGPRLVRSLTAVWRNDPPELVQSMMFHANVAAALAARRAGVERHVTGIRAAQHTAPWRARMERSFVRSAAKHVCVSQAVAQFALSVGKLPAENVMVIPNGVELETLRTAFIDGDAVRGKSIVYVGRLAEQKNVVPLVQNAYRFLDALPGYELLLVGDGPQRGEVAAAIGEQPIRLAGFQADVPSVLPESQLLVLPSSWEGMPNAVLEAMAAGLPVVATDVEGVRELLGARADEQVVPFDDWQRFADRIVAILKEPQLAASLGSDNATRAAEFSVERMVERYIALYDDLLSP